MAAGDSNVTNLVASGYVDAPTLKINATPITATAAEINTGVQPASVGTDGLGRIGCARFTFDATGTVGNRTAAAHGTGVTLPAHAVVIGGNYDVNTAFTSAASTATVAISVEGANDILSALAVSDAKLGTIGRKVIVPKINTVESTSVKTTAAREITVTIAVQDLTGGKLTGWLFYIVSAASA
jgi:hypothetical protein